MIFRELPLASFEGGPVYPHATSFEISTQIRVDRVEEDAFGQVKQTTYSYINEPGKIEVHTSSLAYLQDKGAEHINNVASYMMELLWGKVAPGSGTSECATILGVSRQRVNQLMKKGKMPETFTVLAATPVWRTLDVVRFALSRPEI